MSHSNKRKIAQLERIASGRRAGGLSDVWHRMKKNKPAMAGLVIITIFILAAIFADLIADFDTLVVAQNTAIRLQPPHAPHCFGTAMDATSLPVLSMAHAFLCPLRL